MGDENGGHSEGELIIGALLLRLNPPKKEIRWTAAWQEARALIYASRGRLAAGLALMLVSRVAVVVLPASAKFLIDDVMGKQNYALLPQLGQSARRLQEKATSRSNPQPTQ
jgi:subfamily B ATP-binding cassette protein MsbA